MAIIYSRRRRRNEVARVNDEIARLELRGVRLPFVQLAQKALRIVRARGPRRR